MRNPIKPWTNHRQVLWAVGVFGLIFWALAALWVFLVGGFGPGKQVPRAGFTDLLGFIVLSLPCVYYIVVAHRAWTRELWHIGVVMHALMLILFFASVIASGGRTMALLPFLIVGPITWILHARRNILTKTPG